MRIATLSLIFILIAATASADPAVDAQHEGLRELKTAMEQAFNTRDVAKILARVDENVVFTTMNGDVVTGREGVRAYFERMMNGPNKIVESVKVSFVPDALSILHGGDMAVSWGSTDDHYELASGQSLDIKARWSGTMVLRDGQWIVANFHYSTNMFDNPVLATQRKMLVGGGAAFAFVLAFIGYWLGKRAGRRPA